jgi:hypothetical protein
MTVSLVIVAMGALMVLILTELVAATLPVVIVIAMVPPEEREGLAKLLATADSSRKLRLWKALRIAVRDRRRQLRAQAERARGEMRSRGGDLNLYGVEAHFHGEDVNLRRAQAPDAVRQH